VTTDWQALISTAAVDQFTRHGRLGAFRLARRDLLELAAQVMRQDIPPDKAKDVVAIRCHVHCEPLSRAVVVDEWVERLPYTGREPT
jgi:hypothetical protein